MKVLGLILDPESDKVLLVTRQDAGPDYGLFCGILGEPTGAETAEEALSRATREDTGLHVEPVAWQHKLTIDGADGQETRVYLARAPIYGATNQKAGRRIAFLSARSHWDREPVGKRLAWILPFVINAESSRVTSAASAS